MKVTLLCQRLEPRHRSHPTDLFIPSCHPVMTFCKINHFPATLILTAYCMCLSSSVLGTAEPDNIYGRAPYVIVLTSLYGTPVIAESLTRSFNGVPQQGHCV